MSLKTIPFDAAKYLYDEASQLELLNDAFASGDAAYIANALGIVARARGMSRVAKDAELSRESLYRSLSDSGNPEFVTILRVMRALGLQLTAMPAGAV